MQLTVKQAFRNPSFARRLEDALSQGAGVRRARVSHLTGRAQIDHDGSVDTSWIAQLVRALAGEAACRRATPAGLPISLPEEARAHLREEKFQAPPDAFAPSRPPDDRVWHAMEAGAVLRELNASNEGLGADEADRRRREFGSNALPEAQPPSGVEIFFSQFKSLPVMLLLGSAGLSVATGGVLDAAITLAVVLANAGIGYSTESAAQRSILAMTKRSSWRVRVRRAGQAQEVSSDDIVPGDILLLQAGVVAPADVRIIRTDDLYANEALLTGESEPVAKSVGVVAPGAPISAQSNIVRRGAFIASGSGEAVVVATGAQTEIGRIEAAAASVKPPPTVLEQDLGRLGSELTVISSLVCAGVLGLGVLRGRPMVEMLKSSVALAVAAVPEGLPAISTTALALELRRLRAKKVIARRLHAVEALGALRVLCFDKTGTLTQNEMAVTEVLLGEGGRIQCSSENAAAPELRSQLLRLLEIGVLCSDVEISEGEGGLHFEGSGTETAIVTLANRNGIDPRHIRDRQARIDARLRTHMRRMMATLHRRDGEDGAMIAAKGDPRTILDRCKALFVEGETRELGEEAREKIRADLEAMAHRGLRVLGVAVGEAAGEEGWFDTPLTWLGAVGLSNPLREGTREVVSDLQRAGVRTVMITGDQSATAGAIASELDLSGGEPLQILDASDVSGMPPELLAALCQKTHAFARVSPSQKLDIVRALQADGSVVGMTGDGFNDAPAMKAADVAIAIGLDSAGAARDVADIIIDGDHIRHIADGVAYGRTVRANVRKAVRFMLATNLSEILVVLSETLFQGDQIESPLELLWLNLVTDILPGLGLALEPPEEHVMARPLTHGIRIFDDGDLKDAGLKSLLMAGGALAAHGYGLARYGPGPNTRALTLFSLITGQLLHAYSCRADRPEDLAKGSFFSNRTLNIGVGASFALQALPIFSPTVRRLLGVGRLSLADLGVAAATGFASFGVIEAGKVLAKPRPGGAADKKEPNHA